MRLLLLPAAFNAVKVKTHQSMYTLLHSLPNETFSFLLMGHIIYSSKTVLLNISLWLIH